MKLKLLALMFVLGGCKTTNRDERMPQPNHQEQIVSKENIAENDEQKGSPFDEDEKAPSRDGSGESKATDDTQNQNTPPEFEESVEITDDQQAGTPKKPVEHNIPNPIILGDEKGNGGDVIYCDSPPAGETQKVFSLDLWEAKNKWRRSPDLDPTENREELVRLLLNRITTIDPVIGAKLEGYHKTFAEESQFVDGRNIPSIPDQGITDIPEGCKLRQGAIQIPPALPGDKFYTFDKDLWDAMDPPNQASLQVHEYIFRWLTTDQCECSPERLKAMAGQHIRYYFTQFVEEKSLTFLEYLDALKTIRLPAAKFDGVNIRLDVEPEVEGEVILVGAFWVGTGHIAPLPESRGISLTQEVGKPTLYVMTEKGKLKSIRNWQTPPRLFPVPLNLSADCPLESVKNGEVTPVMSDQLLDIEYATSAPIGTHILSILEILPEAGQTIRVPDCFEGESNVYALNGRVRVSFGE